MPYLIVRVNTLPKNAPVELEMIATVNKKEYTVECSPGSISVCDKARKLAYQCIRFDGLESYFASDVLTGTGRVDVYMEANERLGEDVKAQI